jgi:hypothetical protein
MRGCGSVRSARTAGQTRVAQVLPAHHDLHREHVTGVQLSKRPARGQPCQLLASRSAQRPVRGELLDEIGCRHTECHSLKIASSIDRGADGCPVAG